MAQLNVTELDFDEIKANLKDFLNGQSEFSDYDFEGSGLSVLIDLLAYNTHYNGMMAHMLGNENFIDTAIKRESVVSIAKALGYTPRSMRAAQGKVNIVVNPPASFTSTTMELSRDTSFSATVDGTTYDFFPNETVTTSATTAGGAGPYFLYGTHTTLGKGFYYPVYLTEAAATAAETGGLGITSYTFKEHNGVTFFAPNSSKKEAQENLGTTTTSGDATVISTGLNFGMYIGQSATSSNKTQFVLPGLTVKEGTRVANQFVVNTGAEVGPYVIPNKQVDTTTLRVRVQNSSVDLTQTTYSKESSFLKVKADSKVYFVEEGADGLFQIRFGDGIIGNKLENGNIIIVDYLATKGTRANNALSFSLNGTVTSSGEITTVGTHTKSVSGSIQESIDEIRHNAPKFNATRDRAVTSSDYETLILASNSNIQSASVWGGEKNDPPIYGKVFISLNPVLGTIITEADKDNIKTQVIEPKTPVAITPEFVDPEFTFITLNIGVVYNPKLTTFAKGQIEEAARISVNEYFSRELNKLNKSFYNTKLHDLIKESSDSIISVNINAKLQKRITPDLAKPKNYTVKFNQRLQPGEVTSTFFDITSSNVTQQVQLRDKPGATVIAPKYSGTGVVNAIKADGTIIAEVGTIDYDSGTIELPSITINALAGTETQLRIGAGLQNDNKDITTQALVRTSDVSTAAVVAKPARNTVLTLDDSVVNSTINTNAGLIISATPEVEEI
tara:strand:- start:5812 stop:8001 length:2190 start_codon:yes stop_codon:yes gene_type:complete